MAACRAQVLVPAAGHEDGPAALAFPYAGGLVPSRRFARRAYANILGAPAAPRDPPISASAALEPQSGLVPFARLAFGASDGMVRPVPPNVTAAIACEPVELGLVPSGRTAYWALLRRLGAAHHPLMIALAAPEEPDLVPRPSASGAGLADRGALPLESASPAERIPADWDVVPGRAAAGTGPGGPILVPGVAAPVAV